MDLFHAAVMGGFEIRFGSFATIKNIWQDLPPIPVYGKSPLNY